MCKFFLRVANKVQKKQFLERIEAPEKNWKFSASDAKEREYGTITWKLTRHDSQHGHESGAVVCGAR